MEDEVEEAKNYLLEQINEQYKNYPEIVDAIEKSIQASDFSFIEGRNLFDRVYGRMLEIVVAVLYQEYLEPVDMKGADFVVVKSPLITIDQKGVEVDLNDDSTYNSRALPVVKGELLEFKSAINGNLPIKFIIKNGIIKDYQYNNLLVAWTKNNNDFYFPYLLYIKKEDVKRALENNVKSKYSKYKTFKNEQVEGEEKSMITLDLHIWKPVSLCRRNLLQFCRPLNNKTLQADLW